MARKQIINKIPFALAVALTLYSFIKVGASQFLDYPFSIPLILGAAGLIITSTFILLRQNLWKHTYAFLLLISFSPFVQFYWQTFIIGIGPIRIELVGFALLILHLVFNREVFHDFIGLFKSSRQEAEVSRQKRVVRFEKKFENKDQDELQQIVEEKSLVPEAVEAAENILYHKEIRKK